MALHTDIPTRAEIERLLTTRGPACVSIYLPTSPITQDAQGDRIELKNLASEAAAQLRDGEASPHDIAAIEEPLQDLVDDGDFWARQSHSLAIFATPSSVKTFRVPNRLGTFVEVSDRFHLKPLLRVVTFPQAAFVLALAQGSVRLLELTADLPPFEVHVPDLPTDVASAVGKASIADRSASRRIQGSEGQKVRMGQYARQVDHALRPVLAGQELPLILASTEPLDAIFRSLNTYPHLARAGIAGSAGQASDADLAAAARTVLDGIYADELAAVRELFEARSAQGRARTDVADVARASTYGAVDTVLVDIDETVPGTIDEESGAVTFAEHDDAVNYGVVDEIARRVLLTGGKVLAVRRDDIPGQSSVAAILRYPV